MNDLILTVIIGIGATAIMDLWGVMRAPLFSVPLPNYGMLGRWLGHMRHGRFRHHSIAASAPVHGEQTIGWTVHYLTGVIFAAVLMSIWGSTWLEHPTVVPALVVGIGSVAAPFLLMQPGMGAGIAASKTVRPGSARLQSLINHAVFGFGLYISGLLVSMMFSN